ncbi:MAG: ABC transporter ATP-binding protein [Clostridium sp.]
MSGVVLKNIKKVYDNKFTAVQDFNLEIGEDEFIVFVGPSGCGKSTTLRMIAGLEEISDGELYINDILCNDVAPKDRDIAMVFQNYALYPHMTCYENMSFALKLRKTPKDVIHEKVMEAAKILDIEYLLDRKPKALSGGQRQRVAMGRAIVRNPKVFLMDEPLSNLDAKLRVQMRTEIAKLHKKLNTTFIYVTHDQTEAMTLGTRIVVMKDGVAQQIASPKEIYENPSNLFVAGFIGSPQMNTFYGTTFEKDGKIYLNTLGNDIELPKEKADKIRGTKNANAEVIVGIRPENISCKEIDLKNTALIFECPVDITENLGAETLIYINVDDRQLTIRTTTAEAPELGGRIRFTMDVNRIHIFDKGEQVTLF